MSGINYLLDTCIIIELYNERQDVITTIAQRHISLDACAISPISRIEVLGFGGLSDNDNQNLKTLLSHLATLAIDKNIENTVIDLRRRHKINLPDAIILATALVYHLELLTLDNHLVSKYQQETTK